MCSGFFVVLVFFQQLFSLFVIVFNFSFVPRVYFIFGRVDSMGEEICVAINSGELPQKVEKLIFCKIRAP